MVKRTQVSTVIAKDIKQLLQHMAVDDQVSLRDLLERLITQEHNRRNAPAYLSMGDGVEATVSVSPSKKEPA
jgi:hypothetical protein